jgi:hypothetical protein
MEKQLRKKLEDLTPDQKPGFGIMTPQHMVEHLILTVKLSQGKITVPTIEPTPEALAIKHNILYDKGEIPKGIRAPGTKGELLPLRFGSLDEAKEKLIDAWKHFELYYFQYPEAQLKHPFFGPLTYEEWKEFHAKHFQHHFSQFGIDWKH